MPLWAIRDRLSAASRSPSGGASFIDSIVDPAAVDPRGQVSDTDDRPRWLSPGSDVASRLFGDHPLPLRDQASVLGGEREQVGGNRERAPGPAEKDEIELAGRSGEPGVLEQCHRHEHGHDELGVGSVRGRGPPYDLVNCRRKISRPVDCGHSSDGESRAGRCLSRREKTANISHGSRNKAVHETHSRRAVLAGGASAAVGALAGCLGQDDDGETPGGSEGSDGTQAPFRDWLVTPESLGELGGNNRLYRFSYSTFLIAQTLQNGRASVLDIDPAVVDGSLVQLPALIFFGSFDRSGLETTVEDAEGYALTGEYESYRTAENAEAGTQFALGDEAVLIGQDLESWIDTRTGDGKQLEETTPVFTQLFDRLPSLDGSVTGQLGPPQGFDASLDGLEAWVNSAPEPVPGETITQRWVYAFDEQPSEDATGAIERELSGNPLIDEVTETTVDGAFLTVTGKSTRPESNN